MKVRKALPYLALLSGVLFVFLTLVVVYAPAKLVGLDSFLHSLVIPLQTRAILNIMLIFTNFGSVGGIVAGLLVLMVVYRHRPDVITRLWIALIGSVFSGEYLKALVQRARPETLPGLQSILDSYSYPSGHANGSMVFYGFLGLLIYVHTTGKIRKFFAIAIPAVFIILIGLSRLILNYHFASDVLGGYLLGAFWLTFSLSVPLYYELYHQTTQERLIHSEPVFRDVL